MFLVDIVNVMNIVQRVGKGLISRLSSNNLLQIRPPRMTRYVICLILLLLLKYCFFYFIISIRNFLINFHFPFTFRFCWLLDYCAKGSRSL